jgi:hypothetical protein
VAENGFPLTGKGEEMIMMEEAVEETTPIKINDPTTNIIADVTVIIITITDVTTEDILHHHLRMKEKEEIEEVVNRQIWTENLIVM